MKKIYKMSKKLSLSLIVLIGFLTSCQNDSVQEVEAKSSAEEINMCTEVMPINLDSKGSVLTSTKWTPGATIRIKFLNGDTFLQNKVKQFAISWLTYANLNYQWVGRNDNADVKIAFKFNNDTSSWSYLGTYCNYIDQNNPSMNFGWFNSGTPDSEFSRTVTHEFGHALGLIHEQSQPNSSIPWDKQKVYAYYKSNNPTWTDAYIDDNVLFKYSASITNSSAYDTASIMHYVVPASLTTNGFSVGWNNYLSVTDKNFIMATYPHSTPRNVATVFKHAYHNYYQSAYVVGLPVGSYTLSQLQAKGILNDDISSLVINDGYEIVLFEHDNFGGRSMSFTGIVQYLLNNNFNDMTTSIIVRVKG